MKKYLSKSVFFSPHVSESRVDVRVDQQEADADTDPTAPYFDVVWLDERPEEDLLQDQYWSEQFSSLKEYHPLVFHDYWKCAEHLDELPLSARVLVVVQEECARDLVIQTHTFCPIKAFFVVCPESLNTDGRNDWVSEYVKVSSFFFLYRSQRYLQVKHLHLNQLTDQVHIYEARFLRHTNELLRINIFNPTGMSEKSSTELNGYFLFSQLLLDSLLRMERKSTDQDEFLERCTERYARDPAKQAKMVQFHRSYKPKQAFFWYSDDGFIFSELNKAFRTLNIDMLFLFRFFMQDLEQ